MRLAMAQMLVECGERERNLERARGMIREAGVQGAQVVVLPECLDLGWTFPGARTLAQPIPGTSSEALASAAREAGLYVVAGITERNGDRLHNTALLISPGGEVLLKHRKINELEIALDLYDTGDSLALAHTPLGTVAVTICADNFPSSLVFGHAVARMGARMLLSPCAWAVDGDHDNRKKPYGGLWMESYTTLARLYDLFVVGVSNVGWLTAGPWKGRKCIGCSLAVGPGGKLLVQGPYGESAECLMMVELELSPAIARGTLMAEALKHRGYEGP